MEILNRQFGLAIAYLLPGFIALAGIAPFAPVVAGWLQGGQTTSFGAPIYAILAATTAGMILSCFRWLILDPLHALTGVTDSTFNAKALEERPTAFNYLVESHYRYYQFYGNALIAGVWTYSTYRLIGTSERLGFGTDIGMLILCAVLFAGSRDALIKYRNRSRQLSGQTTLIHSEDIPMTNGIDHNQGNGKQTEKTPAVPKQETSSGTPNSAPTGQVPSQATKQ